MDQRGAVEKDDWLPVVGRSLAFLCLHYGEMRDKTLLEQAEFLERLGLPRKESAALLGTTEDSLRVMAGRAKRSANTRKSGKKAGAKRTGGAGAKRT